METQISAGSRAETELAAMCRHFEELRVTAYLCPAGVWTAGYGHTRDIQAGQRISAEQAERWLQDDLAEAGKIVLRHVLVELAPHQLAALKDFVFNVGPGKAGEKDGFVVLKNGKPSTMLKKLNAGDFDGAAAEFRKWRMAAGQVMAGLITRRKAEETMFRGGDWRSAIEEGMPQAVEQAPGMKPLVQSRTVRAGGIGLTATGVIACVQQLRDVGAAAREAAGAIGIEAVNPGWVASAILVGVVGYMLWRRWDDQRKAEAG